MESHDWIHQAYEKIWHNEEAATEERHRVQCLLPCFPGRAAGRTIVVRDEYPKIWEYVKSMCIKRHRGGLVITGQPGIGKSSFLYYTMAMALQEKIPVAFYDEPGFYVLCTEKECMRHDTSLDKCHHEFFLALVDSNGALGSPPAPFQDRVQPCYTIQATPPKRSLWKAWAKEREADFWMMPLWSENEVAKLQNLYEQEKMNVWGNGEAYYTPLETFYLLGPSARKCFDPLGNPKASQGPGVDFEAYLDPTAIFRDVDTFIDALSDGLIPAQKQEDQFHRFLFGIDGSNSGNPSVDVVPRYHVPTNFLQRVLSSCFRGLELEEQTAFAAKLADYPQVASILYVPLVIDCLQLSETPHECCLVDGSSFELGPGVRVARYPMNPNDFFDTAGDNCIYVPHSGLASINAVVLSENKTRVTFLQMTVAKKHSVNPRDCHNVMRSMRGLRTVKNWSFIFVTPNDNGRIMAEKVKWIPVGREKMLVRMGWLSIGGRGGFLADVLQELAKTDVADVEEPDSDEQS